ncbi:TetR/AcrR family transcriptional regulator [Labedella phragmitis]|uniref:TetR/AcrR family transcriptional regulator n=2 Tax=Labedella phragmitis TaxID=2498849 RepID=A0A3S4A4D7_9MICO|nr:TetR/AcrR family transcriptional regulator [Labedella phragmitis]RWZ51185.1 TetR/AcrR family transcriptional regulator [Labedella phragmitis]
MTVTASRTLTDDVADRIVSAADALFYTRGFQAVGMDEVRTAAGVSLKKLYQQFPSKEALVLAVLRVRHALWETGVAEAVAAATTPREKLLAMYDYLASWFQDDSFRGCGFINAFGELGSVFPSVAELARDHKESFQSYVESLVTSAGADESLAPQLALLAEGAQTTAAISGNPIAATHARAAASVLIDAALAARS